MGESALEVARRLRPDLQWVARGDYEAVATVGRFELVLAVYDASETSGALVWDERFGCALYSAMDPSPSAALSAVTSWAAGYARDLAALAGVG